MNEAYFITIIVSNVLLLVITPSQFVCHTTMILRWYRENPSDGHNIARAIRVGLPLVDVKHKSLGEGEVWGYAVPEADRDVTKKNTIKFKNEAITGVIIDPSFVTKTYTTES